MSSLFDFFWNQSVVRQVDQRSDQQESAAGAEPAERETRRSTGKAGTDDHGAEIGRDTLEAHLKARS